ncbi:MAG: 4Fe-4S dicluster domain-containing protein [Thermodesulfobacteria bacterium]|nr:4Fe-4S dicluster domain-containing protein [Thermodesulfobacteriota bacterium]
MKQGKQAGEIEKWVKKLSPDFERCFRCGACSGVCPVKKTTGVFDPRKIVHALLLGQKETVLNEILWYCSQCGSCIEVCPMDVKPKEVIAGLRKYALENGLIDKEKLFELGAFARVDAEKCVVCLTCVRVCPFGVPVVRVEKEEEDYKMYAWIDENECKGCGVCVDYCPVKAIEFGKKPELQEVLP